MTKMKTRRGSRAARPIAAVISAAAIAMTLAGCSCLTQMPRDPQALAAGDRCYINDGKFVMADQYYSRMGSLALVERQLRENDQWRNCEVNEAIYRLRKIHGLP
ncbi:MAG: hypothetical protein NTY46_07945 [Candidatus Sumerlaeota bacterium]|nr:hypothetical protein [Candidatus Sumerlaeota bacterium]